MYNAHEVCRVDSKGRKENCNYSYGYELLLRVAFANEPLFHHPFWPTFSSEQRESATASRNSISLVGPASKDSSFA